MTVEMCAAGNSENKQKKKTKKKSSPFLIEIFN